jgi:UDP-N-acetylmuramate--L-alanine ligase/UDP-N-acetylenolpyruvoylglucosamine reductase
VRAERRLTMLTKQQLIDFLGAEARHVHFIGIGGVGMSGLARLLLQQGHHVTGSDATPNGLADGLRRLGATVRTGHAVAHLPADTELVIFTAAIRADNPELAAARDCHIPCVQRGLLLTALMNHQCNIAVAGTHGKTTTSSMIAHVLTRSDSAPSYCIGAHVPVLGSNAQLGAGKYFVAEACESDGTLINFTPEMAVCLNIEAEHLDHHGSMERLLGTFETLFLSTRGTLFYCADCANCRTVAGQARMAISFGLDEAADYRAVDIAPTARGSRFTVLCRQQKLGDVELAIPGKQNVVNALAAIAVADQLGLAFEKVAAALGVFTGAARRFERKFDQGGIVVVDDYAHHPTEIKATLAAAKSLGFKRIIAAFQPHRYTRTQALREEFATAFARADRLYLTEIYAASEEPIAGISGRTIFEAVMTTGHSSVVYESDVGPLAERLAAEAQPGDLVLVMGAGNIDKVATDVAARLRQRLPATVNTGRGMEADLWELLSEKSQIRRNEPMARHTSMRVGGPAEWWIEPWNERDLARLLQYCHERQMPVTVVGRGTNLLVRDGGIAGVVVQLGSPEFSRVRVDGLQLTAGAGVKLRAIVNEAKHHNVGGFEFMEGIPATLGGALRMNAGAMGRQMFDVVEWVRYVSPAGVMYDADARSVPVTYRNCPLLASHIAVSAILRGQPVACAVIEAKVKEYTERRWETQPNEPSAGCVFKNPRQIPAGKLIDELGLKGQRVGGACVSAKHGNFIVNTGAATAADVLRLIGIIREQVRQQRGIELEPEVQIVGREP